MEAHKHKKIIGIAVIALLFSILAFSIGGGTTTYFNNSSCNCSNFNVSLEQKVNKSGDTMTGNLNIGNNIIFNVAKIEGDSNKTRIEFHNGSDPRTIFFAEKDSINDWSQLYSDWNYFIWWNYAGGVVQNELDMQYGLQYKYHNSLKLNIDDTTTSNYNILDNKNSNIINTGIINTSGDINLTNNNITDVNTISISNGINLLSTSINLYNYSINITTNNQTGHLFLRVDNQTGTNNASSIHCNSHCLINYTDVYFKQNNNNISFYKQENITDAGYFIINITSASQNITMHYGENKSISDSNGQKANDFFDDFNNGSTINTSKWATSGSLTQANGEIYGTGTLTSINSYSVVFNLSSRQKVNSANNYLMMWADSSTPSFWTAWRTGNTYFTTERYPTILDTATSIPNDFNFHVFSINKNDSVTTHYFYFDNIYIQSMSGISNNANKIIKYSDNNTIDWIYGNANMIQNSNVSYGSENIGYTYQSGQRNYCIKVDYNGNLISTLGYC